ncbi:hypothetical protein TcCL_Unassigned00547 [Trypanosoma cruzi]|nr:hypothetical protein TcCL_Unassigned00547 [Trypanosoma cruzi]
MPVQKRIPKRREKKTKNSLPPQRPHPTTQVIITETNTTHGNSQGSEFPVANLHGCSPTHLSGVHRSAAFFLPAAHNRVHPHPSPRRLQRPNRQPPNDCCRHHTPAPKHATQHHVTWPLRRQHVMSTVWPAHGTINRQNREVRQALNQGLSIHTHTHNALLMPPLLPRARYPSGKLQAVRKASSEETTPHIHMKSATQAAAAAGSVGKDAPY